MRAAVDPPLATVVKAAVEYVVAMGPCDNGEEGEGGYCDVEGCRYCALASALARYEDWKNARNRLPAMKTITVDFDGVLHDLRCEWVSATAIDGAPLLGAFEWLARCVRVFHVAIWSSRSMQEGGPEAMLQWFVRHGLPEDVLLALTFPSVKPPALLHVDDRAVCFSGIYPEPEELAAFEPWHSRD